MSELAIAWPDHAYVPGQTLRHREGLWDHVRATARPGMDADTLAASDAFLTGLAFHKAGFYWEAHEVWEAVWMACAPNSAEHRFVQALIQLANAELKLKMGKPRAAVRLCGIAENHLGDATRAGRDCVLGVEVQWLRSGIECCNIRASRLG